MKRLMFPTLLYCFKEEVGKNFGLRRSA